MKKFLLLGLFSVFSLMASANLYLNLYFVLESDLSTPIWFHQMGWVTSNDVNFKFTSGYFPFDDEVIPKYKPVRWVDGYEWHDLAARTFSYTEDQNKNFYLVVELIEYSVTLDVDATMGTASLDKPSGKYAVDSTFLASAAANPGYRFKYWEVYRASDDALLIGKYQLNNPYDYRGEFGVTTPGTGETVGYTKMSFNEAYTEIQSPSFSGIIDAWNLDLRLVPVFEPEGGKTTHFLQVKTNPEGCSFNFQTGKTLEEGELYWINPGNEDWPDGKTRYFVGWSDGSKDVYRQISLTSDSTITANFVLEEELPTTSLGILPIYEITIRGKYGEGLVQYNNNYTDKQTYIIDDAEYSAIFPITACPARGHKFVRWSDGCTLLERYIVVTGNAEYEAIFEEGKYDISAVSSDETAGTTIGSGIYKFGENYHLEALPNDGYQFHHWDFNFGGYMEKMPANPTIWTTSYPYDEGYIGNPEFDWTGDWWFMQNPEDGMAENYDIELTAHFEPLPMGIPSYHLTVKADEHPGENVLFTPFGSNNYYEGEKALAFVSLPNEIIFLGWSDNGSPDQLRFIDMTQDSVITALWQERPAGITKHHLSALSADDTQGVAWEDNDNPEHGRFTRIEAQAKTGNEFDHWQDGSTQPVRYISVLKDTIYTAYFKPAEPRYDLTVLSAIPAQGKVVGSGSYKAGEEVLIYALPADGFEFLQWNDGNTNASRTVTVSDDAAQNIYVASFQEKQATGVERTTRSTEAVKFLRNGQVFILRDGHIYNLLGIEIQ